MPLLLVSKLESESISKMMVLRLPQVAQRYPLLLELLKAESYELSIRAYINRVFNTKGEVVKEYKQLTLLNPVRVPLWGPCIDFTLYHVRDGIPQGYFIELLLINFRIKKKGQASVMETPIFPNEFHVELSAEVPESVKNLVKAQEEALKSIGRDIETVGLLFDVGLGHVAADLMEGLTRYYMSDFEGAVKFFRKVVEGLRNYVGSKDVVIEGMGENRRKLLGESLSKAFSLISNFGEHSGTYGFMPEATLSKDIAVAFSRYIASYLRGAPQRAIQPWPARG